MSFSAINSLLSKKMGQKNGLAKKIQATLICEKFDEIIKNKWGEKIEHTARALYFKDNVLTIASLSSSAAQEIKLNETNILDELNQEFNNAIKKIRYLT